MSLRLTSLVIDAHDVAAQARWWAETLQWTVSYEAADEVCVEAPFVLDEAREVDIFERTPELTFVPVPESKTIKNRLHLDLAARKGEDQAVEVERLLARGATRVDVGQNATDVTWVVLADPEGNEFCILSSRD